MNKRSRVILTVAGIAVAVAVVFAWLPPRRPVEPGKVSGIGRAAVSTARPPALRSGGHEAGPLDVPVDGRIEGVVSWQSGAPPPPDAVVSLMCYAAELRNRFPMRTPLDGEGRYAFEHLPLGAYELKCGREPVTLSGMVYAGRELVRRVGLTDQDPVAHEDFQWEDVPRVSGLVVDEAGSGIADAVVTTGVTGGDTTRTGEDGRFVLWRLEAEDEPAKYNLEAVATGYAIGKAEITLARGAQPPEVRITLSRGTELRGRVIDTGGNPVAGANLVIGSELFSQADAQGNYECLGVAAGEHSCLVSFKKESGSATQVPLQPAPLVVPQGGRVFEQDIVVSVESGTVSGTVVNARGEPLGGPQANIFVEGVQTSPEAQQPTVQVDQAVGEDGRFRLTGFDPGPVDLTAFSLLRHGVVRVQVPAGTQGLKIVLPDRVELLVQVADARTGSPVLEANIIPVLYQSPDGETSRGPRNWGLKAEATETPGTYRLSNLTPGRFALQVEAEGYARRYFKDVAAPAGGGESTIFLAMEPSVTCMCRVVPQGFLAQIADRLEVVTVTREAVPDPETLNSPGEDAFSCVLAQGENVVKVRVRDPETRQSWVKGYIFSVDATSQEVHIPVGGDGIVKGTVPTTAEGAAAGVKLSSAGRTDDLPCTSSAVQSQPDGRFQLEGIEPGSYLLRSGDYQAKVQVADGRTTVVNAAEMVLVKEEKHE